MQIPFDLSAKQTAKLTVLDATMAMLGAMLTALGATLPVPRSGATAKCETTDDGTTSLAALVTIPALVLSGSPFYAFNSERNLEDSLCRTRMQCSAARRHLPGRQPRGCDSARPREQSGWTREADRHHLRGCV